MYYLRRTSAGLVLFLHFLIFVNYSFHWSVHSSTFNVTTESNLTSSNNDSEHQGYNALNSPIEYPYGIVGIVTATLALAQFTIFVMARHTLYADGTKEANAKVNDDYNKSTDNEGNSCTGWVKDPVKRIQIGLKLMLFLFWTLPIGEYKSLKEHDRSI